MITKTIDIALPENVKDARPIAMLVQVASKYKSSINIKQKDRTVNAKSIMGMMTLGLVTGEQINVSADGEDEEAAMNNIESFLNGQE